MAEKRPWWQPKPSPLANRRISDVAAEQVRASRAVPFVERGQTDGWPSAIGHDLQGAMPVQEDVAGIAYLLRMLQGMQPGPAFDPMAAHNFAQIPAAMWRGVQEHPIGTLASMAPLPGLPPALRAMTEAPPVPAIVYHGTPHRFAPTPRNPLGEFDLSKIGTGEGAQVYGHGIYLADQPGVAKSYQRNLAGRVGVEGAAPIPRQASGHQALDFKSDLEQYIGILKSVPQSDMIPFLRKRIAQRIERWEGEQARHPGGGSATDDMNALVSWFRNHEQSIAPERVVFDPGTTYRVDLPDEQIARMLDWDAPLAAQPQSVQAGLRPLGYTPQPPLFIEPNPRGGFRIVDRPGGNPWYGRNFYDRASAEQMLGKPSTDYGSDIMGSLQMNLGREEAASALGSVGIPGLRYLDQGSRAAGRGTRNYVVWEPDILRILGIEP